MNMEIQIDDKIRLRSITAWVEFNADEKEVEAIRQQLIARIMGWD